MATSIKISQLPAKGSNLEATDLLEVSEFNGTGYVSKSITGQEIIDSVPASVTAWGTITGTLSAQTDLNTALSGKVPTTRTLTINGTTQDLSADRTFTISTGITIGTTAITSGTVGRVLFEGTGNVVQESGNLFWDNTNGRLGIGTSTPSAIIHSVGSVTASSNLGRAVFINTNLIGTTSSDILVGMDINPAFSGNHLSYTVLRLNQSSALSHYGENKPYTSFMYGTSEVSRTYMDGLFKLNFKSYGNGGAQSGFNFQTLGAATSAMMIFNSGNIGINTTTDAGFKLDVNGTARVSGQITTTTANAQFGTVGASTGNFRIDGVNGAGYAFAVYSSSTLRFGVVGYGGIDMPNGFNVVTGSTDLTTTRLRIGTGNTTGAVNIQAQTGNTDIVSFKASNGVDQFTIKNTSGNILVGTSTDIASSKLTIESTTQGFLPPRMTTTQKNAIASPSAGLVVYDSTLNKLCVRTASAWETVTSL
jgi:hypothetical protein